MFKKYQNMTKLELLYQELLKKEVMRYKEIENIATDILNRPLSSHYLYNEYINKLRRKNKLLHPMRGIYAAVPPTKINDESFQPDKILIASKIKQEYYLGHHTALEVYGTAYSAYNTVYVVIPVEKRFRKFQFKNITYRPVYSSYPNVGVNVRTHKNHHIRVSSPSRTFIDCIDKPEYAGGWEECLKSLESLSGISSKDLKNLLGTLGKDMLFRKTGFVLSVLSNSPYYEGILDDLYDFLESHIGKSPMYLIEGKESRLNQKWNLYVPTDFHTILRGV